MIVSEFLDYLKKKFLGIYEPERDLVSRKRRMSPDNEEYHFKQRRLNHYEMPRISSPIDDNCDTPSTSKKFLKVSSRSPRPFTVRQAEVIDLSDDEDVIEIKYKREPSVLFTAAKDDDDGWIDARKGKRNFLARRSFLQSRSSIKQFPETPKFNHSSVIRKAKNSITNCNSILSSATNNTNSYKPGTILNESYRMTEKENYKKLLANALTQKSSSFSFDLLNCDKKQIPKKTSSFTELYTKRLLEQKSLPTIDLTDEGNKIKSISIVDSDSDDIKCEIPPDFTKSKCTSVNSLQKFLDTEPVTNYDWLSEWNSRFTKRSEVKKKLIQEEKIKVDKFSDVNRANVQCRLEEKLKTCMRLQEIVLLDEEPDIQEVPVLPELSAEQERAINQALKFEPRNQVLIEKFCLRITRNDIQTLRGLNWLNDEVINFYVNLLSERGNGKLPNLPKVHSMNTFFYPKLMSQGYSSLRRWTKKVDIFAKDLVVIPVHLGVHWCMAMIDFRTKHIRYYDSMGSANTKCLSMLLEYLKEEYLDKKKSEYDISGWKTVCVREIPQQMNGSDCGMFACMYAEFLTRNCKITFTQEHMPYFRRKMVYEIITGELLLK